MCNIASPTSAPAAKASKTFRNAFIDERYLPSLVLNFGPIQNAQVNPQTAISNEEPIAHNQGCSMESYYVCSSWSS
jgi:hypothetical protein